jgi:hypothetical protein
MVNMFTRALALSTLLCGCVQSEPATWSPTPTETAPAAPTSPEPTASAPEPAPTPSAGAAPSATGTSAGTGATPAAPCPAGSWRTLDEGPFSFQAPCELVNKPVQGIDSKVGRYEGGGMTLTYDHGWYSDDLRDRDKLPGATVQQMTISGKSARVITFKSTNPSSPAPFGAGVYFAEVGPAPGKAKVRMNMVVEGKKPQDQVTAKKMFESIRFK